MRYREIKQAEETNCCKKDVSSLLKCIDKINAETETMKKILQNWSGKNGYAIKCCRKTKR